MVSDAPSGPFQVANPDYIATERAASLFQKAADAGLPLAQFAMGDLYAAGEGVEKDYGQAVSWFEKAARRGNDESQYRLGGLYHLGQGDLAQMYNSCIQGWINYYRHFCGSRLHPTLRRIDAYLTRW